jgi:hypothetical protein
MLGGALGACQFPDYVVTPPAAPPSEELDPCATNPCLNDGRCIPFQGSFVCLCRDGFRGDTCQANFDDCSPDPCQNGGTCVDGNDASSCRCPMGWDGATCQHNIDDCAAAPCQNGGTCVDAVNAFTCNCPAGFRGDTCEVTFNGCDPDPCQNGGTCLSSSDSSFCQCRAGWDGATCQHDIDDCSPNPCGNGGTCTDALNSHSCTCTAGFTGDDCTKTTYASCQAIKANAPNSIDGVYSVDPDGPGAGSRPPFEVLCDMSLTGGGWTMVGQEREGDSGTFKYLGVEVGDPEGAARRGENALLGARFKGLYSEFRVTWSSQKSVGAAIYFRITEEAFANTLRTSMPVTDFWTNDGTMNGWVTGAGGVRFCRASVSPSVRPGDTSWAIKPQDVPVGDCGCNAAGWSGHGAFYGGHPDANFCTPSGGGWAGVVDEGQTKGNITNWATKIWIR